MRLVLTLILVGIMVLPQSSFAADQSIPVSASVPVVDEGSARQLRIYREALLQGSSDEVRVDAAVGLLLNQDATGRDVLVSALRMSDNPSAVKAVCRALIKTRVAGTSIGSREMFLEPLLEILGAADIETARLAAEGLLVFNFDSLSAHFHSLLNDATLDKRVRQNVIYALQIRPEPAALRELIKLLDASDPDVVRAAETALQESFGLPVGTSRQVWKQILDELRQKSPSEIQRERLLRQEMRLREMQAERDLWQKLYLGALDKQYETADEATRMTMILNRLGSELPAIRVWALDKIDRYPTDGQGTMREKLLALLSDESRLVRLKTARVLNNMSALNPAEKLLERFRLEEDPEVALAMFEALGEACFFAFSPGSKIVLPAEIKDQTLQIAETYLNSDDIETSKKGAEIIRKLLELNGLPQNKSPHYLEALAKRYELSVQRNSALRSELLGMMARLCQSTAQRERAAGLYKPYFVEAIGIEDNPAVRLAAARGLSNLDKAEALRLFKQYNVVQTGSPAVLEIVIDAAGAAGLPKDLEWLVGFLASNGHSESSAQAFRAICQRCDAVVCSEWANKLAESGLKNGLMRDLLELAEQKAMVEKNELLLADVRIRLIEYFVQQQKPDLLAAFVQRLKTNGGNLAFPDAITGRAVDTLMMGGFFDAACDLVRVRLERGSLQKDSAVVVKLDSFFETELATPEAKKSLFEKLSALKSNNNDIVFWASKVDFWSKQIAAQPTPVSVLDAPAVQEVP